jgi:hypothetical protein
VTRDEAEKIWGSNLSIDAFVKLGMLKLDDPAEMDRRAAFECLCRESPTNTTYNSMVLDILIKHGFKITR